MARHILVDALDRDRCTSVAAEKAVDAARMGGTCPEAQETWRVPEDEPKGPPVWLGWYLLGLTVAFFAGAFGGAIWAIVELAQ